MTSPQVGPRSSELPSVLVVLSSANRRGAEIQGFGLASELKRRGVPTDVVALRPSNGSAGLDLDVIGDSSGRSLSTIRTLRRRAGNVDVVIGYGSVTLPTSSVALAAASTSFVYRSIGDPRAWVRGGLHRARTGFMFRRADRVAALFNGAAAAVHDLYGVASDRIAVIPNARNASEFTAPTAEQRAAARARFGLPDDAVVVAQVGSLGPEKRVPLGIAAVGCVPDAHVLVAGDGAERLDVAEAASRIGDRIHLLGVVPDIAAVYHAADLVLSTSSTEGMPGVLIEAALSGVPSVATDVGATAEVVGPGGVVVPADAPAELIASAIERVLQSRGAYATAAEQHARTTFTWDVVADRWLELLRTLS